MSCTVRWTMPRSPRNCSRKPHHDNRPPLALPLPAAGSARTGDAVPPAASVAGAGVPGMRRQEAGEGKAMTPPQLLAALGLALAAYLAVGFVRAGVILWHAAGLRLSPWED